MRKTNFFYGMTMMVLALLLLACSGNSQRRSMLFNVDSLMDNQIKALVRHKATVTKQALLKGVNEVTTLTPSDSSAWNDELAIFLELDIVNKPIYKDSYKVERYPDTKSNLTVKAFSTTDELPISSLKLYYHNSLPHLRRLEAHYQEANSLYKSARYLKMDFENIYGETLLTSYSISGGQHMFLDDSVQYFINAKINLKN